MKNEKVRELYVIKDNIADDFGPVFEAVNEGVAVRSFKRVICKSEYPGDFSLYRVGYLDFDMVLVPELHMVVIKESIDCTLENYAGYVEEYRKTHDDDQLPMSEMEWRKEMKKLK